MTGVGSEWGTNVHAAYLALWHEIFAIFFHCFFCFSYGDDLLGQFARGHSGQISQFAQNHSDEAIDFAKSHRAEITQFAKEHKGEIAQFTKTHGSTMAKFAGKQFSQKMT